MIDGILAGAGFLIVITSITLVLLLLVAVVRGEWWPRV